MGGRSFAAVSTTETTPHAARGAISDRAARHDLVLGGAVFTTGLLAGFFYSYAASVMPGLHGAADETVVDAMQNINRATENPVFFATFMGAPALAVWAYVRKRGRGAPRIAPSILGGTILMGICLFLTAVVNIPLNDELERAGNVATIADVGAVRDDFWTPWVVWNIVRTVAIVGAFGCLARALHLRGRLGR